MKNPIQISEISVVILQCLLLWLSDNQEIEKVLKLH